MVAHIRIRAFPAVVCGVLAAVALGVAVESFATPPTTPFSADSASLGPFAGYNISGRIRSVVAEWRVPRLTARGCDGVESTWVGAQGPAPKGEATTASSAPFAQIGTIGGCLEGHFGVDRAFWSATSQGFLPHDVGGASALDPNDLVSASMTLTADGWTLRFADVTRAWSVSIPPDTVDEPRSGYGIAEFLQEDPGSSLPFNTNPAPYANTTPVDFLNVRVDGTVPRLTFGEEVWMGSPGPVALAPTPDGKAGFSIQSRRLSHAALQYLSDVVVRNNAVNDFDVVLDHSNSNADPPQLAAAAKSNIAASVRFEQDLREQRWPARAARDVSWLLAVDDEEVGALIPLARQSESAGEWRSRFAPFNRASFAASSALRAALGIPRSA